MPVSRGSKQRQLAVALPDDMRSHLEAAAETAGRSIADEIRRRLESTIAGDAGDPVTRELLHAIPSLAYAIKMITQTEWHGSAATANLLGQAIRWRLNRMVPGANEAVFTSEEIQAFQQNGMTVPSEGTDPKVLGKFFEAFLTLAEMSSRGEWPAGWPDLRSKER